MTKYIALKSEKEMQQVGALHYGMGGAWTSALKFADFKKAMGETVGKIYSRADLEEKLHAPAQLLNILIEKGYFAKIEN